MITMFEVKSILSIKYIIITMIISIFMIVFDFKELKSKGLKKESNIILGIASFYIIFSFSTYIVFHFLKL